MIPLLCVLLIAFMGGIALFSFIKPVTTSRYEQLVSEPIDTPLSLEERDQAK